VRQAEFEDTKPPPRYTEATLLSAMRPPASGSTTRRLRGRLKDSGLGTRRRRAETIEVLIRREYIERAGKELQPTRRACR